MSSYRDTNIKRTKNWGYALLNIEDDGTMTLMRLFTMKSHLTVAVKNCQTSLYLAPLNVCVWDIKEAKAVWVGRLREYTKTSF